MTMEHHRSPLRIDAPALGRLWSAVARLLTSGVFGFELAAGGLPAAQVERLLGRR